MGRAVSGHPHRAVIVAMLAVVFVGGGVAAPASAAPVSTTVDGITYEADDADVAAGATVTAYTPGSLDVTIPATVDIGGTIYDVRTIGLNAFFGQGITSVSIPSSVTTIGPAAFQNNSLSAISIPSSVASLGNYAFFNNPISTLVIPDSVISIGNSAFNANALTSLTLGNGLQSIGANAFRDSDLTSITIPPSVLTIGLDAFYNNLLTGVTIGSGVTIVGPTAFAQNPLTSVTIGASVTTIGSNAFTSTAGTLATVSFLGAAPASVGTTVFDVSDPLVTFMPAYGAYLSPGVSPTRPGRAIARRRPWVQSPSMRTGTDPTRRRRALRSASRSPSPQSGMSTATGWSAGSPARAAAPSGTSLPIFSPQT